MLSVNSPRPAARRLIRTQSRFFMVLRAGPHVRAHIMRAYEQLFPSNGLTKRKNLFGRREKEPVRKGDTDNFVFKDDVSKDEQGLNVKPLFTLRIILLQRI